jgi:hypothetical protein
MPAGQVGNIQLWMHSLGGQITMNVWQVCMPAQRLGMLACEYMLYLGWGAGSCMHDKFANIWYACTTNLRSQMWMHIQLANSWWCMHGRFVIFNRECIAYLAIGRNARLTIQPHWPTLSHLCHTFSMVKSYCIFTLWVWIHFEFVRSIMKSYLTCMPSVMTAHIYLCLRCDFISGLS